MILIYNNLTIRNATNSDAAQLCAWWNDGSVMAHTGFPNGVSTTVSEIRKSLASDSDDLGRRHIIEYCGAPIGEMNYRNKGNAVAEIGIKICVASAQEKGYGTILLTMFMDALFTYYDYEKIVLDTNAENKRAQHVYKEKLGFRCLGIRENSWRDQLGGLQSSIDYEMEKHEWKNRRQLSYIRLRLEAPRDYRAVEELTRAAFWQNTDRGVLVDEHLLVHKLRKLPAYVPELDYIAEIDGVIAGNVIYSKARVILADGEEHEVLTFGPLAVLPEYQNRGVGKALMHFTIHQAKRLGYTAIVICGEPDYYPRFGFRRAAEFGLYYAGRGTFDAFMAMELMDGALCYTYSTTCMGGEFHVDDVFFDLPAEEVRAFDLAFPSMELRPVVPVEVLLERLDSAAQGTIKSLNLPCLGELRSYSQREIALLPCINDHAIETIRKVMLEHGRIWGEGGTPS